MKTLRTSTGIGLLVVAISAVGILVIAGCPATTGPGANEVVMRNIAFDPTEITINVGESVTWTNMDFVPHTATSGNPGDADSGSIFRSPQLAHGASFTHTFNEAGEYLYFCEVHPTIMRDARVIVLAGN